jgi:hypothetical protein
MKFIPARDLRIRPGAVWKKLSKDNVVVTSKGKPVALMSRITADTLESEIEALERTQALMALDRMQRAAVKSGRDRMTDAEIEAEIRAVRRARRK